MSDTALSFYKRKHAVYSGRQKELGKSLRLLVFLRLSTFILMIALPLLVSGYNTQLAFLLFALLLVIFLVLLKRYANLEGRRKYISSLLEINLNEIGAKRGNLGPFGDGNAYIDPGHNYSYDLDIFGGNSLFRYLNRCCTWQGEDKLASMLSQSAGKISMIKRRQKAFRELSEKPGYCQHFIATGRMLPDESGGVRQLYDFLHSRSFFLRSRTLVLISRILPVSTLGSVILAVFGFFPLSVPVVLFLIQLFITGMMTGRINIAHSRVTRGLNTLKKYTRLLGIIEEEKFSSPLLKSLQRHLKSSGKTPSWHIGKLSSIAGALDNRLNIFAAIFLNGLLLWDINCVILLEYWKRRHRKHMPRWFDAIARMDAYVSFSIFTFNNTGFVFPSPSEEGPVVSAKDMGHPLIPRKERVCNDFCIDRQGKFIIITGANMAGKSTFLRTTGVSLVLAIAGAPVCASEFRFSMVDLFTSMRTTDSLNRNESYFYAELKRFRQLIDMAAGGAGVFVLLDEILKGTNTTDKQKGSEALLRRMIDLGATGIVATHDLSLTLMEESLPGNIENRCFETFIEGDRVFFDYLLRDGVTRKMNAMVLMKQMGLLPGRKFAGLN